MPLAAIAPLRSVTAGTVIAGMLTIGVAWAEDRHGAGWGYEGATGPEHWGSIDPAYATCSLGSAQSPIDFAGAQPGIRPQIAFDYHPLRAEVVTLPHTIQVNVPRGSAIAIDRTRYQLLQFHFHHRSEHTVAGIRFPLEMHLVHQSDTGALAVLGILFREGAANETLAPIWELLPARQGDPVQLPGTVDLGAVLPERRTTWRYTGSLTTPPCTEGVSWLVMTESMTLSAAQIAVFGAIVDSNFRPVQPLNDRVVFRDEEAR